MYGKKNISFISECGDFDELFAEIDVSRKYDPPRTIGHYGLSYRQIGFGQPERDCIDRRRTVFIQDGDRCLLSDLLPVANCPDTTKQKCEYDGKYVSHNLGTK